MRIGIDYRMLSAGRIAVNRGMGRYTQQQLREVLRLDRTSQYVLFCRRDADRSAILPEILAAPNVSVAFLPPRGGELLNHADRFLAAMADLERAVAEQQLDVFHATTPFRPEDLVPPRLDGVRVVATHYDLIPLLFPEHYYRAEHHQLWYQRGLLFTRRSDQLIAISHHVRRDAIHHLGVDESRIRVAYPVADPCFHPRPAIRGGEYLLSVSHLHYTKNLLALLDAYRLLPAPLRRRLPLVLAGDYNADEAGIARAWAREREIDVELTGFVSDDELAALYSGATIVIHPSRYEGFGLPVLEAMQCGAPVIAANASSLPEIAGDAALLFDPESAHDLARAIARLAEDETLRRTLSERGLARATTFTPEQLGRATLDAYEAAAHAQKPPRKEMHLALWTPLPPQQSGISDYSTELLRELVAWADVDVFVDDGVAPDVGLFDLAAIRTFTEFERCVSARAYDAVLYQLGASFFHVYLIDAINRWPGIVTLHDLTWGNLLYRVAALCQEPGDFGRRLTASEGESVGASFRDIEGDPPGERGRRLEVLLNRHWVLRDVIASSIAQIVHIPPAREQLMTQYPEAEVFAFTMGVDDPHDDAATDAVRARFGIPESAFLIGTFGVIDPVKRVESLIHAIARLQSECDAALVVVGRFYDPQYQERLHDLAESLGIRERVVFTGHVTKEDFTGLLLACDVMANLRYPFRQQMSATLMRGIAAGKPVLISDVPGWSHFPASFCLRITPDEREVVSITDALLELWRDPALRVRVSEAARRYYLDEATTARMAGNYRRVIEEVTSFREQLANA